MFMIHFIIKKHRLGPSVTFIMYEISYIVSPLYFLLLYFWCFLLKFLMFFEDKINVIYLVASRKCASFVSFFSNVANVMKHS